MNINRAMGLIALAIGAAWGTTAAANDVFVWGLPFGGSNHVHTDRQIPYFAEHPPVYYSYPVPRTYGYSPYAYLPNVMTPTLEFDAEPLSIDNPYVPQRTEPLPSPASPHQQTATAIEVEPLVIVNPYVNSPASLVKHERAR